MSKTHSIVDRDGHTNKMTPKRAEVLRQVVKTNGGGVAYYAQDAGWKRAADYLVEQGLIQGKSGNLARAVHTRVGLEVARELDRIEAAGVTR